MSTSVLWMLTAQPFISSQLSYMCFSFSNSITLEEMGSSRVPKGVPHQTVFAGESIGSRVRHTVLDLTFAYLVLLVTASFLLICSKTFFFLHLIFFFSVIYLGLQLLLNIQVTNSCFFLCYCSFKQLFPHKSFFFYLTL